MVSTLEILIAAKAKIADPEHWTQQAYSRDADGNYATPTDESACRWCAYGAIISVAPTTLHAEEAIDACATLLTEGGCDNGVQLNDSYDHAMVMKMFDCAIRKEQKK